MDLEVGGKPSTLAGEETERRICDMIVESLRVEVVGCTRSAGAAASN
jgi:hypothetical protein